MCIGCVHVLVRVLTYLAILLQVNRNHTDDDAIDPETFCDVMQSNGLDRPPYLNRVTTQISVSLTLASAAFPSVRTTE